MGLVLAHFRVLVKSYEREKSGMTHLLCSSLQEYEERSYSPNPFGHLISRCRTKAVGCHSLTRQNEFIQRDI